ncbi:mandelate racemase/muconate lactonizing enzyme family protein [Streptomyces sp. NPDC005840]|uniref:mandelate racemase/muconate lactonizing enzyme family protein n=1 Tax=Streptomyces sp. NPDC005840 TaxID=3157072 RepID=UPI0033CEDF1E
MIITDVEAIWLRVPSFDQPCEWGEDAFIVRIHTDTGLVGVGESDSSPAVLRAIVETPASHSTCRGLREILIGRNPLDIDGLWRAMLDESSYMGRSGAAVHAISAIDIALWDLAGQHAGVPVHHLLGGALRDSIPAYGTFIPSSDPQESAARAGALVEQGFRAMKIGGGPFGLDPDQDHETLRAVRKAIGSEIGLAVDLVYRWRDYQYALDQTRMFAEFDLMWVEEPISPDDPTGLRRLGEDSPTPISGGEFLSTAPEFEAFIHDTRPAIVQPDITRCGGITEIRRINQLATRASCRLVPHGFSTGILMAATSHFLSSIPGGDLIECSQSTSPLARGLVANPLQLEVGNLRIGTAPGLGIELDEELLERYRVRC